MKRILLFTFLFFGISLASRLNAQATCETGTPGGLTVNLRGSTSGDTLKTPTIMGTSTVCFGEATPVIVFTGGGGSKPYTFSYKINGGSTLTVTTNGTNDTVQVLHPTNAAGTFAYSLVSVTDTTSGAGCSKLAGATANEVTIIVHGELVAGSVSADQTICYGETPAAISANAPTGGSGTFSYLWQVSTDNVDFTNVSGAESLTYAPGALTGTTYYRLLQIDGFCTPDDTVITDTITITVHDQLMAGDASANQTICYNTIPAQLNATAPTGGSGTLSYVWQVSSNNVDFTTIPDSSGLTYTPGLLTDTMYYRLLQIDTYCSPDDTVITDTITITVLPEFIAGNATANQTICYNTAPAQLNATAPTGGNGSYTYQWQVSSDNVTFNNITDSTSLVLSPGALTSTTYYRLAQTSGNSCGTIYTDTLTITVNPELTATTCVVTDPCQNGLGVITVNISGGTSTYTAKMTGKFNITTSQGAANSDVFSPAVKELSTTGSDTQVTFTGLFGNATYKILVQDSNNCTVGEIHPQP